MNRVLLVLLILTILTWRMLKEQRYLMGIVVGIMTVVCAVAGWLFEANPLMTGGLALLAGLALCLTSAFCFACLGLAAGVGRNGD